MTDEKISMATKKFNLLYEPRVNTRFVWGDESDGNAFRVEFRRSKPFNRFQKFMIETCFGCRVYD